MIFGQRHVFALCIFLRGSRRVLKGLPFVLSKETSLEYILAVEVLVELAENEFKDVNELTVSFLTLCDLALFCPLGRVCGSLRPENTKWEDVHPGFRFLQAVDCFAKNERWIDSFEDAGSLSESISSRLGWQPSRKFFGAGIAGR